MACINENANEANQMPPSPPADQGGGGGDGEDRISVLCDDVLVRILGLADIDDARELVRTGVLSRRWRGLWTRVPSLRFMSPLPLELESAAGEVGRYLAFVNNVLAQRARSEASIDLLVIHLFMLVECLWGQRPKFEPPVVEAAEAWIRYAVQHHVRRFYLNLRLPLEARQDFSDLERELEELSKNPKDFTDNPDEKQETDEQEDNPDEKQEANEQEDDEEAHDEDYPNIFYYQTDGDQSDGDDNDDEEDKPVIDLDELPSSTELETMYLWLSRARVRLPSTAVFASLKSLTLEFVELAPGSGHLLARLSSSACCPSLQRLRMARVSFKRAGTRELVLDAGELLVLSMEDMDQLKSLELRTPSLVYLEITECSQLRALTAVWAPVLEKLTFQHNRSPVTILGDFPCVWHLETGFITHLLTDDNTNDDKIWLLKRCSSSVTSLVAHLDVPSEIERRVDLIKDKMPQLPNVTSLAVHIGPMVERHSFEDGVAGLLTRFNNLEYLTLQLDELPAGCIKRDEYYPKDADGDPASFICNHADNWESNSSEISLGSLREAAFKGMTGTGCKLRFLQMVVASATGFERAIVNFSANYNLEDSRMHYFLHTLLADGTWTACEDGYGHSYEWTPSP